MTRIITQLDRDLLNSEHSLEWNIYAQFGIDLRQQLLPGFQYNVSAFYWPIEVQDEFLAWVDENWEALSKHYDKPVLNKKIWDKALQWLILDVFPSNSEEHYMSHELIVYKPEDIE